MRPPIDGSSTSSPVVVQQRDVRANIGEVEARPNVVSRSARTVLNYPNDEFTECGSFLAANASEITKLR